MASLVTAQLMAVPAAAADLTQDQDTIASRSGGFAGARLRLSLDPQERRPLHAGLVLAPVVQSAGSDGEIATRFGEAVEFGIRSGGSPALTIAGQDLRGGLSAAQDDDDDDSGPSTLLLVGGGLLLALGVGAFVFMDMMEDASE
jgi:hypothetical protein